MRAHYMQPLLKDVFAIVGIPPTAAASLAKDAARQLSKGLSRRDLFVPPLTLVIGLVVTLVKAVASFYLD